METAIIKCPTCGADFPAGARFCSKCGYTVPPTTTHPAVDVIVAPAAPPTIMYVEQPVVTATNWTPWIAGIVVVLLAAGGGVLWNMGYLGGTAATPVVVTGDKALAAAPAPATPQSITINTPPAPAAATPPPVINITNPPPADAPAVTPPAANPPLSSTKPEIVSVSARPLDTSGAQWKEGYELKLRNQSGTEIRVNVKVQFLDANGYVVDDDLMNDLVVPAYSEKSFAGADMIDAAVAPTVKSVKALFR